MRLWLLFLIVLPATASAASPPICALPAPAAMAAVDAKPASPSAERPTPGRLYAPAVRTTAAPIPAALAELPFVKHVAATGGTITDLGTSHGLQDLAPDGQAAVSGAPIDGLQCYFVRSGAQFQVFYATRSAVALASKSMTRREWPIGGHEARLHAA